MPGGQAAAGAMPVPDLTRLLEAEGVKRIIVTTDEPDKYDAGARWGRGTEVWHRDRLDEAQRVLRDIAGVTVLVHDQRCAAEKRRLRKRGRLENPALRVFINESVCEGCGDCGVKSNCLSVQPVDTEFGRKTQIHQSSCNKDYSCLNGDCPSFLTVVPIEGTRKKERKLFKVEHALPEPELKVSRAAAAGLQTAIDRFTRKDENVYLDALGLAETLFDDHMAANMIVLGAAYQAGAIPVASAAIEEAIVLNGVSVAMNTHAFRAGRLLVADPAWVATLKKHRVGEVEVAPVLTADARALVDRPGASGELRR